MFISQIKFYSKVPIPKSYTKINDIKEFLLSKYKDCNWNKANSHFNYNNFLINFKLKFNTVLSYDKKDKSPILNIENIEIPIRKQDFFHIYMITKLKKNKKLKNDWFDDDGYLDTNFFSIEDKHKIKNTEIFYRTDMKIKLTETKYLCVEFFEHYHKKLNDNDFQYEKNRIYKMLFDNDNQDKIIVHFAIFWEHDLFEDDKVKEFIKHIIKKIEDYNNIEDEHESCINAINKFIGSRILSENLYNSFLDKNKPIIKFETINNLIKWKEKNSHKEYLKNFINFIEELKNLGNNKNDDDDFIFLGNNETINNSCEKEIYYQDNYLTWYGLSHYLNNIEIIFLENCLAKKNINDLATNITNGFITGIKEKHDLIISLNKNLIYGFD